MTLTLLRCKMFEVGDLPVLSLGNCVLKTGVINSSLKLFVRFLRFFSKSKHDFLRFLTCCTRFLERWAHLYKEPGFRASC